VQGTAIPEEQNKATSDHETAAPGRRAHSGLRTAALIEESAKSFGEYRGEVHRHGGRFGARRTQRRQRRNAVALEGAADAVQRLALEGKSNPVGPAGSAEEVKGDVSLR